MADRHLYLKNNHKSKKIQKHHISCTRQGQEAADDIIVGQVQRQTAAHSLTN